MVEQTKAIFLQENIEDVANGTLLSIHARYFILIFDIGFHLKKDLCIMVMYVKTIWINERTWKA